MSELSTRLHLRRKELGLSQEELAQRMGYRSKSSITKLEKGINDLPQSKVEELAAALETTPDIVCIRCQPEVEQGEIAAVRIGGEATLKHFHRQGDAVMLLADNAAVCPPMIFTGLQLEELHIEGRAVGLCRGL